VITAVNAKKKGVRAVTADSDNVKPKRRRVVERALQPLEDYVTPGRRKTDNPLIVGVVVLCLGVTALSGIFQITATLWAGSQLRTLLDKQAERDTVVDNARARLFKSTEAQAIVLRRLCLNTARDEKERSECLSVAPALPTESGVPVLPHKGSR
jgi:hypothetical protein